MYETDNFDHIIKQIRAREDASRHAYERWQARAEADAKARPWIMAIVVAFVMIAWAVCYLNGP